MPEKSDVVTQDSRILGPKTIRNIIYILSMGAALAGGGIGLGQALPGESQAVVDQQCRTAVEVMRTDLAAIKETVGEIKSSLRQVSDAVHGIQIEMARDRRETGGSR